MQSDPDWEFLAALVQLLDVDRSTTGRKVATQVAIDQTEATAILTRLRNRRLVDFEPTGPRRVTQHDLDRTLVITADGYTAAAAGKIGI